MSVEKHANIYGYRGLMYTVCNPQVTSKLKEGLQGISGSHVAVVPKKSWQKDINKLFFGEG